jgi:hypothetical protein
VKSIGQSNLWEAFPMVLIVPLDLPGIPPVDPAAAIFPRIARATAPTVPISPCFLCSQSWRRKTVTKKVIIDKFKTTLLEEVIGCLADDHTMGTLL